MKTAILCLLLVLMGCGGDANEYSEEETAAAQTVPQGTQLQCYHDGDIWLCNEQNSCIRDESIEEVVAETESGGLARLRKDGPITIIAECGSNVSYSQTVTVTTTTVTTNG